MKELQEDAKARCRWMRWVSLAAAIGLSAFIAMGLAGALLAVRTEPRPNLIPVAAVLLLPALFYIYALFAIERSFAALARGRLLLPVLATALQRVGIALMLGAATSILLVYNLLRLIADYPGGYLHFDVPGIVLGVVGAALLPLADLLRRAHAVEVELDEII